MSILSIDFGGTRTRAGFFKSTAGGLTLIRRDEMPSRVEEGAERVLSRMIALGRQVTDGEPVGAIGISAPGPLDPAKGLIFHARTLPGWSEVRLGERLSEAFGAPSAMQNDANLAALAEFHRGAGQGCDPLIYLTLSTGIGGGVVIGGRLFSGWSGLASEPGHQLFRLPNGEIKRLEELASGTGIGVQARRALAETDMPSSLRDLPIEHVDGKAVGEAAQAGDLFALNQIADAGRWLGMGLTNLLHLFSPQRVVVGGSVAQLGSLLFDPAEAVIRENILDARFIPPQLIVPAALGDDVCLIGAAFHAAAEFESSL